MNSGQLILGSASPRRARLLKTLGVRFQVRAPRISTEPVDAGDPEQGALAAARLKARSLDLRADEVVLSADTLVVKDGRPMGKPSCPDQAEAMLLALSGGWHRVITGVWIRSYKECEMGRFETTRVRFRQLRPQEISAYVATGETVDKAGAYGIQGAAGAFVDRLEGCVSNVVGLPLATTCQLLRRFGIPVLGLPERQG